MNKIKFYLLAIVSIMFLSCKDKVVEHQIGNEIIIGTKDIIEDKSPKLTNFTKEDVSKFAISVIMHQPPNKMEVSNSNDVYIVSYIRKSDKQKFDYKVKFIGDRIIWGNTDGRWRDTTQDENLNFIESGNKLKIIQTFSDGSKSIEEFEK